VHGKEILSHTFDEFAAMVKSFHGSAAPGVIIGGFMVELAYRMLPENGLYDVICETAKCLPDAVQLLTPCSIGNRWLTIIDTGRYGLTFYDKRNGRGIRVYLDYKRCEPWPEIRDWYLKLKPKQMQNGALLFAQIREAGVSLFGTEQVLVDLTSRLPAKKGSGSIAICPSCDEAYRASDGAVCPACRGAGLPYASKAAHREGPRPVLAAR
jgi:formylmethanofuran dehydrogenase subunit E